MIIIIGACLGIGWGYNHARKRKGNRFDKLQYAAIYGMIMAVLGLILTLFVDRLFL